MLRQKLGDSCSRELDCYVDHTKTDLQEDQLTFSYTLQAPDREPPRIIRGTVADGAKNTDPGPLNADKIQITFNENVVGSVALNL